MNRVIFYPSTLETFDNLPYTEDTIHEYDVELIIKFLKEHKADEKLVAKYLIKIIDNSNLIQPKIENIFENTKEFRRIVQKEIIREYEEHYNKKT
jgi:hypothetical protein